MKKRKEFPFFMAVYYLFLNKNLDFHLLEYLLQIMRFAKKILSEKLCFILNSTLDQCNIFQSN